MPAVARCWTCASRARGSYPCGLFAPDFGPGGAASEILIDPTLTTLVHASSASAWSGPGIPVVLDVVVPALPSLDGLALFSQGVFLDPTAVEIALTNALDIVLGS